MMQKDKKLLYELNGVEYDHEGYFSERCTSSR